MGIVDKKMMVTFLALTLILYTEGQTIDETFAPAPEIIKEVSLCSLKVPAYYGQQVADSLLGKAKLSKEGSILVARWGKSCHNEFTQYLISLNHTAEAHDILRRSAAIWNDSISVVQELSSLLQFALHN